MKFTHFLLLPAFLALPVHADTGAEKEALRYLLQELKTIDHLIDAAQRQSTDSVDGIQFNYHALRNDKILMMRGIEDYINERHYMPRRFEPLQGDYRR